jgi:hypothetical protein
MTTLKQLQTLETIALKRIISFCSADSKLDWQVLPKVFHETIHKGIHRNRFAPTHENLRRYFNHTNGGRWRAAVSNGDYCYNPLNDINDWFEEYPDDVFEREGDYWENDRLYKFFLNNTLKSSVNALKASTGVHSVRD